MAPHSDRCFESLWDSKQGGSGLPENRRFRGHHPHTLPGGNSILWISVEHFCGMVGSTSARTLTMLSLIWVEGDRPPRAQTPPPTIDKHPSSR